MQLDAIIDWNMSQLESEAFKIALIYDKLFRKIYSENPSDHSFVQNTIPQKSDPRKSNLFKQCWKLRRQTRGLIEFSEYQNYIHANLTIIKLNNGKIIPNCICGDKAWIRYKVWKRKYDIKIAEISGKTPPPSVSTTSPKIIIEIDRTKKFLFEICDGTVTEEKILKFIKNGMFNLWMVSGKVSAYYIALSPFVAKSGEVNSIFSLSSTSLASVKEKITLEVVNYFRYEYAHEFV